MNSTQDLHQLNTRALDWIIDQGRCQVRSGEEVIGTLILRASGDAYAECPNGRWFIEKTAVGFFMADGISGHEVARFVRKNASMPTSGTLCLEGERYIGWRNSPASGAWVEGEEVLIQYARESESRGRLKIENLTIVMDEMFPMLLFAGVYLSSKDHL